MLVRVLNTVRLVVSLLFVVSPGLAQEPPRFSESYYVAPTSAHGDEADALDACARAFRSPLVGTFIERQTPEIVEFVADCVADTSNPAFARECDIALARSQIDLIILLSATETSDGWLMTAQAMSPAMAGSVWASDTVVDEDDPVLAGREGCAALGASLALARQSQAPSPTRAPEGPDPGDVAPNDSTRADASDVPAGVDAERPWPGLESDDGTNTERRTARNDSGSSTADTTQAIVGLGIGTGVGLSTGQPNANAMEVQLNPGVSLTPFHLAVQVGHDITPRLAVLATLRAQVVFLETGIEPLLLGALRARREIRNREKFRSYVDLGVGYGSVSHTVYLPPLDVYDTTTEGPGHVGVGWGFGYWLSPGAGVQTDVYSMVMFGNAFSVQFDVTAGLALRW